MIRLRQISWSLAVALLVGTAAGASAAEPALKTLEPAFARDVQPLVKRYCHECHSGDRVEADLDLASFVDFAHVRKHPQAWQKVGEMLDSEQMPPKDAKQPTADEQAKLRRWVRDLLTFEAAANAGDPGPVVLRRLNNFEYTATLRDLTGVPTLTPAKEFPVDSAAGEGFTNVGGALVMSPALLGKYLDSAKHVAAHAVLLPGGMRFSPSTTRRDWTNDSLATIREFYGRYTSTAGASAVNLQGVQFDTNRGGRLPVEAYLAATLHEREALKAGKKPIADVARERKLNAKYLAALWQALDRDTPESTLPLDALRTAWRAAKPDDAAALTKLVGQWQAALWKFNSVGQIGRAGSATAWMEPLSPLVARRDFRVKLPASGDDVLVYLSANDVSGGGPATVIWENARFVAPGRPDLPLRDVRRVAHEFLTKRDQQLAQTSACLNAAAEVSGTKIDLPALAAKQKVDADVLGAWLQYLGVQGGEVKLGTPITRKSESGAGYDFIKGWVGDDALSVVANSSDNAVRIPGNMKPHSVAVHPAPKFSVAVGWRSPASATLRISGLVQHAHPECGNGVAWALELRRGAVRQRLAEGTAQGAKEFAIGPLEKIAVQPKDAISLVIDPRDGNHSCDLTAIDLTLHDGTREWNLVRDVSSDLLAGNPHADRHGNKDVWHFYSNPTGAAGQVIPASSLLAKWQLAEASAKKDLANEVQRLLQSGEASLTKNSPDAALYQQLTSLSGPLAAAAMKAALAKPAGEGPKLDSKYGLDPAAFGQLPDGGKVDAGHLAVKATSLVEVRLPAALVAGAELVVGGSLAQQSSQEGAVQLDVLTSKPGALQAAPGAAIVAAEGSPARKRLEAALDEFRMLLPPALCYTQIVPVDEVVTLTLYYREDEHLRRLMLSDEEARQLDRHWDELLFIAQEPLELVTAFDQLSEFATQDRPDVVKELIPLKQPIRDRADAFRKRLVKCEPKQFDALVKFAEQAYRRPLRDGEAKQLRELYAGLRKQELPHDEAFRLTLARVLVAPAFMYRLEQAGPGDKPSAVNDWELANRLSYFLWSSAPDDELRSLAQSGKLREPDVLAAQARRMLRDPKARRLATEFALQWLHINDFEQLNEKSERHFPTFAALRGAMHQESVEFFADLFHNNRSVLSILNADYTFLNEELARHYGIPGVAGQQFRRVDGVRKHGRGGVLAQATTLAKQSGASRTSPILRGNWISEVVLGEKLPKPPKDVPQLADAPPDDLTERQLVERHTADAACAKCHRRIDPFGFALERFDAIGRLRDKNAAGLPIDAATTLPDGTKIDGLDGLRDYLAKTRRQAFVRQFNRKLLGYALGRSVLLTDEPLLKEMQSKLAAGDYSVALAVELVVRSPQFRMIRGREAPKQ